MCVMPIFAVDEDMVGGRVLADPEDRSPGGAGERGLVVIQSVDVFFFSSRRRHTRYWRDWSSDVCSSDLDRLRRTRVLQATVETVDFDRRTLTLAAGGCPLEPLRWDRLALTTGSVTRVLPTPGVETYGLGLKTLVEAQYVHDHVLRQMELADATHDQGERRARLTFVVVGAGYTGTETAAQLQHMTTSQLDRFPRLSPGDVQWVLVDLAPRVLPELGPRLGRAAMRVIRSRGMDVRLGTTVAEITHDGVLLSDGTRLATRTALWTVGVTPPALGERPGPPRGRGRLAGAHPLPLRDAVFGR